MPQLPNENAGPVIDITGPVIVYRTHHVALDHPMRHQILMGIIHSLD